jgi:spermidine/putrescine transport system permease protein
MAASTTSADSVRPLSAADALAHRERSQSLMRGLLLSPAMLVIGIFGIAPLCIILIYSFLKPGDFGGVTWVFSLDAYIQFLFERDLFDDTVLVFTTSYLEIFGRSLLLAGFSTLGCLLIGFPAAYYMATRPPHTRNLWVFLITIPFWSNLLVRTFSVMLILRDEGIVNGVLIWLGLIDRPLTIIYTDFAIGIGLLYTFLPFMVLPLYASLERIDFRLVEAGFDLYANRFQVLRKIIIPLAKPGIIAGCILVFIPGLGAYITPVMLGGGKNLMIGNLIALQFGSSRNWPFGSAAAFILMALVLIALMIYVGQSARAGRRVPGGGGGGPHG